MTEINLAGRWRFALDPHDQGLAEAWHSRALPDTIELPGSLQAHGFGHDITPDTPWIGSIFDRAWFREERFARYREPGNVKVPFWLQPRTHYLGAAWYQREIEIPAADEVRGRHVVLHLERAHWQTEVWLDDQAIGSRDSLSTPHRYDLGALAPGTYRLTIRVDNRLVVDVGPNAHSVSDHTQTAWNGVIGRIALDLVSPLAIDRLDVYPDVARRTLRVHVAISNALGAAVPARLVLGAGGQDAVGDLLTHDVVLDAAGSAFDVDYPLGDAVRLWDEFDPAVYTLDVAVEAVEDAATFAARRSTTFGLREVGVSGTQLAVNGRPISLRGTLECCVWPLTGYPPTDHDTWRTMMRTCQAHGLNHIRFHSWCPPAAAFDVADELGIYLQVEVAAWANQGATVGEGGPLDAWLYQEADRIVAAYGNHPSFLMLAHGNEPGGRYEPFLREWVAHWRQRDPRRVYTSAAGWPAIPENQYHNIPGPRIQQWGDENRSRINALPPETLTDYAEAVAGAGAPLVSHEIGQWCAYPNFGEMPKYTGLLQPRNFEIFQDSLREHHMADQAAAFLYASGKLQALCYKEEIESALRTPGFGGFQLLGLNDFPGQGTALVGVLDAFWESKGYISAAEFRRFCNSTVLLARLPRRFWRKSETLTADLDIAHYGPAPLPDATVEYRLVDDVGNTVAAGTFEHVAIEHGVTRVGTIAAPLRAATPAQRYTLVASIRGADGAADYENSWDVWIFADELDTSPPAGVLVAERLDDAALAHLAGGGTAVLLPPPASIPTDATIGFSSIFWNTSWTKGEGTNHEQPGGQAPHTLGILCDPQHPAFAAFPTEGWSNWQWWELVHGAAAMTLEPLAPEHRPLVQAIDTWFGNRRLGLLFEARVAGGKLLVSSMDLSGDLGDRLVARQLRASLLAYAASDQLQPAHAVTPEIVRSIVERRDGHDAGRAAS